MQVEHGFAHRVVVGYMVNPGKGSRRVRCTHSLAPQALRSLYLFILRNFSQALAFQVQLTKAPLRISTHLDRLAVAMPISNMLTSKVQNFVISSLREEHPWVKIETMQCLARQCADTLQHRVDEQ